MKIAAGRAVGRYSLGQGTFHSRYTGYCLRGYGLKVPAEFGISSLFP